MTDELRDRVHIFGSSFYTMYSIDAYYTGWKDEQLPAAEKRYKLVQGLPSNNVNIFDKDFLVFPCLDAEHWFLTIICYPKGGNSDKTQHESYSNDPKVCSAAGGDGKPDKSSMILCFDSIKSNPARRQKAINHIRTFVKSDFQEKFKKQIKRELIGRHVPSPQQKNGTDCGLFVMEFFERFFIKDPIMHVRHSDLDCSDWFDPRIIKSHGKRREVANIMSDMIGDDFLLPPISFDDEDSQDVEIISCCFEDNREAIDKTSDKTDKEADKPYEEDLQFDKFKLIQFELLNDALAMEPSHQQEDIEKGQDPLESLLDQAIQLLH